MSHVRVMCRVRPASENADSQGCVQVQDVHRVTLQTPPNGRAEFAFDRVFAPEHKQDDIYGEVAPLLDRVLDGLHLCIFAHGQAGAGKSYTLLGGNDLEGGLFGRAILDLLRLAVARRERGWGEYEVRLSALEVANECVQDLLADNGAPSKCELRQCIKGGPWPSPFGSVYLPGMRARCIADASDVEPVLRCILDRRRKRAHCLISLIMRANVPEPAADPATCSGALHIIDLASNENAKSAGIEGQQLMSQAGVHKSLAALGDVLYAVGRGKAVAPFRSSKLTMLLTSPLSTAGSKALFVSHISPEADNARETLSTLRFAARMVRPRANRTLNARALAALGGSTHNGNVAPSLVSSWDSYSVNTNEWFRPQGSENDWPASERAASVAAAEGVTEDQNTPMPSRMPTTVRIHAHATRSQADNASDSSSLSFASAPACSTVPHCFLPDTAFQCSVSKRFVRASELRRAGGERLCGPHGEVKVQRCVRWPSVERDFVSVRLADSHGAFVVTADHRLVARGPTCEATVCKAAELVASTKNNSCDVAVFDGETFRRVTSAVNFVKPASVIEVVFEDDAIALAWVLPRHRRNASVDAASVAVLGKRPTASDKGLQEFRTFMELHPDQQRATSRRARSVGSAPLPDSCWSCGTIGHEERSGQCDVCEQHRRYLVALSAGVIDGAEPCKKGAACPRCHAAGHVARPRGSRRRVN